MFPVFRPELSGIRTWLVLGRISNLPTVWSNCLAAWLLGGAGSWGRWLMLTAGTSLIYVGGMFLNDACDARFDREYRRERPIPNGTVRERDVWGAAGLSLATGWLLLAALGWGPGMLGLLLVSAVVVYDVTHKHVAFSPVTMALCRFLLYLVTGSAARFGVEGEIVWSGLALALYIVGLSYVARGESTPGAGRGWQWFGPLLLLVAPVLLAGLMNPPYTWTRQRVLAPVILFGVWLLRSLSHLFRDETGGARSTVGNLLAGIVLVDVLAVVPQPWPLGCAFLGLFAAALVLQRIAPAT